MKNVLLIAANSDIAKSLADILSNDNTCGGFNIFASFRKNLPEKKDGFTPFTLDLCDEKSFADISLPEGIKFDAVVNFAGVAITSPVEKVDPKELKFQFDVSTIGLARLLKFIRPFLNLNSKVINISSMAAFGIFPFLSPYCAAKAAADILLNAFELETGIRCVSIKPGVVKTKFWEYCIDLNENNFKNFDGEYEKIGRFLLQNAKNNAHKGVSPHDVAKVVFKAIKAKNPRHSYLVGFDSYCASISRFIPKCILNKIIRWTLNRRVRKISNGK